MKRLATFLSALIAVTCLFSQAPEKLSYQAIIRDGSNNLITSQAIGMRVSILQGSVTGVAVYMETHSSTSNANGLVTLEIGSGTVVSGVFASIDWSNGPYFIKTETDPAGGTSYTITGTSQLLSVPFALHAKTAESVTGPITEVDGDPTNELQTLSISGDTIFLDNGGFVKLPPGSGFSGSFDDLSDVPLGLSDGDDDTQLDESQVDAFVANNGYISDPDDDDADSTNEIQSLSIVGNDLSISDGNTVTVPSSPWSVGDATTIYSTGDSIGINTTDPLAPLHIMGSTTLSRMVLSPNEPFSGDDAEIVLTEDDDNTYNMKLNYDGGDNRMYIYGKNNTSINGPHFGVNRDNGRVGIGTGTTNPVSELEVVGTVTATAFDAGDASGLSNVYADSLRGGMSADTNDILQWNGAFWNKIAYGRYAFHASASTDQTVGDEAYDTLRCNNSASGENFECPAGVYDNSTYAFIAPVDGIYFFEAAVLWDNANLAEVRSAIFIRVNNTDEVGEWSVSGGTDFFGTGVSTTLELNAGDEVRVRIYNGDSLNSMDTFSQSGKYCYFSGYMVFAQ